MTDQAQEDVGPAAPVRMTSADPAVVFERLEQTGLISRGGVNIIGLDAVRERLGERWERRRPVVWEHVEAAATRRLGPADLCLQLDETDFAIAVSGVEPVVAQATCLGILREVLEHFLGACNIEDLRLRAVGGFEHGRILCTVLDPAAVGQGADEPAPAVTRTRARSHFNEQPFIMTSMGGRDLRLRHVFEPLVGIASRTPVATVLEPSVIDVASGRRIPGYAFSRLSDPDLWAIDQMTLAAAEDAADAGWPEPPLVLPLAYGSLANSRGRSRLVDLLSHRPGQQLAIAIRNIEPGAPRGPVAELVAMLRRMEITVMVRVAPVRGVLAALELTKANGLILDMEPLANQPAKLAEALRTFGKQAQGMAPVLAMRGAGGAQALAAATAAGFTHWTPGPDAAGDLTLAA